MNRSAGGSLKWSSPLRTLELPRPPRQGNRSREDNSNPPGLIPQVEPSVGFVRRSSASLPHFLTSAGTSSRLPTMFNLLHAVDKVSYEASPHPSPNRLQAFRTNRLRDLPRSHRKPASTLPLPPFAATTKPPSTQGLSGHYIHRISRPQWDVGPCKRVQVSEYNAANSRDPERQRAGRSRVQAGRPGLRARLRVATWTEEDSRGPRSVPPHTLALPRTGPHGASRALRRPELCRRERPSD